MGLFRKCGGLIMKYVTTLGHKDFVLLMEVLKKAQNEGLINWSATALVCKNTEIEFNGKDN